MKTHILKTWLIAGLSLFAISTAWGQTVTYSPSIGATGVSVSPVLSIEFDDAITIENGNIYVYEEDVNGFILPIPSMVEVIIGRPPVTTTINPILSVDSENKTLSIDLSGHTLPYDKTIYVSIDGSVIRVGGTQWNTLDPGDWSVLSSWSFTTEAAPKPLTATLSPVDNALNVPISTPNFVLTFSENVELAGANFYVELFENGVSKEVQSVGVNNILNNKISLSFNYPRQYAKEYSITIPANAIKSVATGALFTGLSAGQWSFTTEAEPITADPPYVVANGYIPAVGAVEVSRAPSISVQFDKPIVWGTGGMFFIRKVTGGQAAVTVSPGQVGATISSDKLSIVFTSPLLEYGTQYYIEITNDFVRAFVGDVPFPGMGFSDGWTFTTETAPPAWVDSYPSISNQTVDDFQLDVWADVTGAFYGVLTQSSTQPTAEQIAQGQNSVGSAARIAFNQVVNSIETFSSIDVDFNDQTLLGQSYFLHLVYRSGGTYPKYGEIKTIEIDRIIPTVEKTYPANNLMVFPAPDAIEITFSELVVGTNGEALNDAYFSLVQNSNPEIPIQFTVSVSAEGERTVATLRPTTVLMDNTAYTLTINTVYDLSDNPSAASTISFETDGIAQWTGSSSSSWTDAANWGGTLPVVGKSVLIPGGLSNYPLINSETINVHNLTIAPGAVLSHSGGTINVSGLFHLQSSSDVNASYINTGGVLNATPDSIRVDQVISNIDLTYIISSPTNSSTAANFGAYFPLYRYDNPTDTWEAISSAMTPGVGYRMWTDDTMVSFTGSFNAGNIGVSLLRTDGQGYGWNFVGNPYPASIDWTELNITEASSVENAFWMWLPTSRSYGSFSAATNIPINISSSIIPSNHGFLVKVKKELGSGSITFSPGAQVGNSTSYLKSASTREVAPHFKLAGVSSSFRDELAIAFVDESSLDLDKFDMEKKFAERKNIFELYSISGESKSVINALPSADKIEIPLGYNALQKGDYSIEMLSNSEDNANVVLVDKLLDVETNLTVGSKYDFTINETGKNSTRFTLKIEKVLTSNQEIKDADNSKAVTVFANDGEIFVNQISAGVFNRYSIVDVQGRLVKEGVLSSAIGSKALGAFDKGLYIVSFSNGKDKNVMNSKVVVY